MIKKETFWMSKLEVLILKGEMANKVRLLICKHKEDLLDAFDKSILQQNLDEEEQEKLLEWAFEFIDKAAELPMRICLDEMEDNLL